MQDPELLQSYARTHAQEAFRALLERYVHLVYSACRRQLGDEHLAEDATQAVFLLLSQRADRLRHDRIAGWLLTVARYTCANIKKTERRRTRREQVVAMQKDAPPAIDDDMFSALDGALAHLGADDREAVALRYLQNHPLREVGAALGISEEAARKRVDRAVEKLRSYFARHHMAATTGALATLLSGAGQKAALAPARVQALTQLIIETCNAGAAGAAPACAIAKGTILMMRTHFLKTAGAIACIAVIIAFSGWRVIAWSTQAQPEIAAARGVTMDLSTPERTLETYCRALKSGDRAAAYACTTTDPRRATTAGDAFLTFNLAQNHLIRAAAKAFNSTGEEARQFPTLDIILERLLAFDRSRNQTATIDGNVARLNVELPEAMLTTFPEDVQKQIRSFADHPLPFMKQGDQWKLGPPATQATILLLDKSGKLIEDPKIQIAVIEEYAGVYDHVANDIGAGRYKAWADAGGALKDAVRQLHDKYGLSNITVRLGPAGGATTKP